VFLVLTPTNCVGITELFMLTTGGNVYFTEYSFVLFPSLRNTLANMKINLPIKNKAIVSFTLNQIFFYSNAITNTLTI
jgi:hypothetical protein